MVSNVQEGCVVVGLSSGGCQTGGVEPVMLLCLLGDGISLQIMYVIMHIVIHRQHGD